MIILSVLINNKNCFIFNTILDLLLESPPQRGGPLSNPPILHWIHAGGTSGEDNILQGASAKAKSAFNSFDSQGMILNGFYRMPFLKKTVMVREAPPSWQMPS